MQGMRAASHWTQLSLDPRSCHPKVPLPCFSTLARRKRSVAASRSETNGVVSTPNYGAVVTDNAVPDGHKGLHGYLYGNEGAEQHDGAYYNYRQGEDDGSTLLDISKYLAERDGEKPLGVYAVHDSKGNLQYVGYSRNIVLAVKAHLARVGEDRCAQLRTMVFRNRAMATRANLEREVANWLEAAGTTPPGNGVERDLWEGNAPVTAYMSPAELEEYEQKKLKMQKAMGESLAEGAEGETQTSAERRLAMIKAVEGDDWSAVIDGQTARTRTAPAADQAAPQPPAAAPQPVISPFTKASVHRSIGNKDVEVGPPPMTVESVDLALNEVRPYLQADGGDVEVVGVDNGTVLLKLQGACGTCPSSTATMKMGIERALRSKFGEQLREVMQVDSALVKASVESLDEHLNQLRPAIRGYGGEVVVLDLTDGVVTLRYKGPKPIMMGVKGALKDQFSDLKDVKFEVQ